MKGTVKKWGNKWGNSAAVRIPASVLQAAHVDVDQDVDAGEEAGRIIIEPVRMRRRYTLEELVAQCGPHAPISAEDREWVDARPVGKEIFQRRNAGTFTTSISISPGVVSRLVHVMC